VREAEPRVIGLPQLLGLGLKMAAMLLVALTPILAAWVASSLAAHQNGSPALAFVVGVMLFPVGPLLWEMWSSGKKRQSRLLDRLILRTLFLSVLFLGVLLGTRPKAAFVALSTRGDWFLDGRSGAAVETTRRVVFAAAARLEWLYLAFHRNPYRDPPRPKGSDGKPAPVEPPHPVVPPPVHATPGESPPKWPLAATLHPVVASMPPSAEASIGSVGYYIAERVRDPVERIKALHDYVVDRVAYDVPALALPSIPFEDADAEAVFRNHKGVCSGYAQLLAALGRVTGDEIAYVVGNARLDPGEDQGGAGHAWNAARVGGRWFLIDPTWDAGAVGDGHFKKGYRTEYLMTPPEVFSLDHFPDEERWQLRTTPLSRGEFMRQPLLRPQFFAEGFELIAPDRSQVTVDSVAEAQVKNRAGRFLIADFVPKLGGESQRCSVDGDALFTVRCAPASAGAYQVRLFSGGERFGTYHSVGRIDVNRR
jgi:transglutaminase-like putative cysteine protease